MSNWRKSSYSFSNGGCAEVGQDGAVIAVRDSQDPGGPVLAFPAGAWTVFTARVRSA